VNASEPAVDLLSLQPPASEVNDPSVITYPTGFSFVEHVNSSLKLTNPSLSAYNPLRVDPTSVVYYPFVYFYSQSLRIAQTPFSNILSVTNAIVDGQPGSISNLNNVNLYGDANKITQLIQMPANPCTSMLVCIYREKDRRFLGKNTKNSYSPALFWNALNVEKAVLWDGGNILFDYCNNIDYEMYSLRDRPDALKVPFKGGCVKVQPSACYATDSSANLGGAFDCNMSSYTNTIVHAENNLTTLTDAAYFGRHFWKTSESKAAIYYPLSIGNRNYNVPISIRNGVYHAFPADSLIACAALNPMGRRHQPCHLTQNYEATILEFCLVMNEPFVMEKEVQSTPSFAKTQLKLEFWINPLLCPEPNGQDDQYDITYGLTRACPTGLPNVSDPNGGGAIDILAPFTFPGATSHSVPDCLRVGVDPVDPELSIRSFWQVGPTTSAISTPHVPYQTANGFDFKKASSWNVNNGGLMVHITFCQNQIWTISPIRTSTLSSRG
jgi:hypothetical protein